MTVTIESDVEGFNSLASQLLSNKEHKSQTQIPEKREEAPQEEIINEIKRSSFRKGDQNFDVDDDAEIEFMADKQPVKMKLAELKDRAAGDVAIKNRMHSLAEEKKKVQSTLKEFGRIAEKDPLDALKYISKQVKEAGTDFEYEKYLSALADQADKLSRMDEKDRRAYKAEKRLQEVEGDLSKKNQENLIGQYAQESQENLGITESQFNRAAEMVLENPVLMESVGSEEEFFETVEEMVIKAKQQKRVEGIISKVDPSEVTNSDLIIELSEMVDDLLPDGTDQDLYDILSEVLKTKSKVKIESRLSEKQRASMPVEQMKAQGASDFHLLVEELKQKRLEKQNRR